jgi:hypothetical protein
MGLMPDRFVLMVVAYHAEDTYCTHARNHDTRAAIDNQGRKYLRI